ncbi:hypothetical protein ECG_04597 [Echinococcus granulosus]|uniref:A kinase anchor protein 84 n=1 Tax=Echinococcus granulosus TaxID=6210 RepID=U6J1E4_ECHGR|nr:hypothetical protein EGR_02664 [Echinococcus granulosus]EUB62532.1 hypothetical protein EGR_02664 [Echinococcus granulosus]KAH9282960.1 hypothetical protein ECG_04597 [Echinococcus granulosus]CDS17121.1 A kinase anchor protein 84 [Echinococcus granulosus]
MSSYRQITALTVVSASLFYLWSRYCRKKKSSQNLPDQKPSCGGPSASAVTEDKQNQIVLTASTEVDESVAPLDEPPIEADLTNVVPEGAFFQEVAESSEIVEEETFISTPPHPVQIDSVAEAHKISESSSVTVKDCSSIIEVNALTDTLSSSKPDSATLAKSLDKDSYEDPVESVIPEITSIPQDLAESADIVHALETACIALGSLKAKAQEATSVIEGSAITVQNTQENIAQTTSVAESQVTPVKPVVMACLNTIQREVPQPTLVVATEDLIEPVKISEVICGAPVSTEPQIATNTEIEVMGYPDDAQQEVSGLISVIQDSVESVDIINSASTAPVSHEPQITTATETETVACANDAQFVIESTNVQDSAEPVDVVEALPTVSAAAEISVATPTGSESIEGLDVIQREAPELTNIVTEDLGEPVTAVQEEATPFALVSSGPQVTTTLTASGALKYVDGAQQEVSELTPLESVCVVQANSASLMTGSDVASGVAKSAEVLGEAVTTLPNSIGAVSSESGSCESVVVTSDSDQAQVAPGDSTVIDGKYQVPQVPAGIFNDPEHDIVEDSPEIFDGTLIPRVLVPSDLLAKAVDEKVWVESINVPAYMGGVLIGRFGKNVRELRADLKAEMTLSMNPGCQNSLLLKISCPLENKDSVNEWVNKRLNTKPSQTTIGNPNQLQRLLPLGQVTDVMVRSLYGQKEFFVTIPDAEYTRYLEMQEELDKDYYALNTPRMQLYEPVTSGTVAILSHRLGFARVVILKVIVTWPRLALCFMLDYGVFSIAPITDLRKIKAKYMRVPFQAIHVSWAHAFPIFEDVPALHILRTLFGDKKVSVFPVRMETCCRSSVVFLERLPPPSADAQPVYCDVLHTAYQYHLFNIVPVVISPSRQMWVNRTDTPYYVCPYSTISYDQCVHYLPDVDVQQPQQEQLQMEHRKHQQSNHQQQQRGGPSQGHNRTRRFGNNNSGGGGSYKRPQNLHPNPRNSRRSRKNGSNHNNGQQQHQQQKKRKEPTATSATART